MFNEYIHFIALQSSKLVEKKIFGNVLVNQRTTARKEEQKGNDKIESQSAFTQRMLPS